jgi:AcrR family transcriptional regulator
MPAAPCGSTEDVGILTRIGRHTNDEVDVGGAKRGTRRDAQATAGVRDRILDAALAVLRESGLQGFTQVRVAERAGVRQSHLTYYFPAREDLVAAVAAHVLDGVVSQVQTAVADAARGTTATLLTRVVMAVANIGQMRAFVGLVVEADAEPTLRPLLVAGAQQVEAAVAATLGGEDAADRARMILAATWGLGLYQLAVRPARPADPTRGYLAWLTGAA